MSHIITGNDGQAPPFSPEPQNNQQYGRQTRSSHRPSSQSGSQEEPIPGITQRLAKMADTPIPVAIKATTRGRNSGGRRIIKGYVRPTGEATPVSRNPETQLDLISMPVRPNEPEIQNLAPVPCKPIGNFVPAETPIFPNPEQENNLTITLGAVFPTKTLVKKPEIMEDEASTPVAKSGPDQGRTTPVAEKFVPIDDNESMFFEDTNTDDPISNMGDTPLAQPFNNSKQGNGPYWNFGQLKKGKRKNEGEQMEVENKKPKSSEPKTASMLLHETCKELVFNYSDMIGPCHDPSFSVTVVYPGSSKEYSGVGRSKKFAKQNVAEIILTDLGIPLPPKEPALSDSGNSFEKSNFTPPNLPAVCLRGPVPASASAPMSIDFSSDDYISIPSSFNSQKNLTEGAPLISPIVLKRLRNIQNLEENCAAAFNSLIAPKTPTYEILSEEGLPHEKIFAIKLTCEDPTNTEIFFIGKGPSKKRARADAAKQALICALGMDSYQALAQFSLAQRVAKVQTGLNSQSEMDVVITDEKQNSEYNIVFADHVANLVIEKYGELMKADEQHLSQKVLSGVVMTTGSTLIENTTVIAVTTGTKCIEGDFMSEKGLALNDCHAEILATRCTRDFIYSELEKLFVEGETPLDQGDYREVDEKSIFEFIQKSNDGVVKFRLKDEIKFHLYISTSPCGDARIFSPKGIGVTEEEVTPADDMMDSHPNRINRGVLRAKIEAGEGTIPVANLNSGPQTWDAILQGNALHTMSCSDKVCRWNAVGIQGALLANFMEPIFYSSITLGSLHHPVHFKRAVITRMEKLESILVSPYKVNRPNLLMVSKQAKRRVKKSPSHAITWSFHWSTHEVLSSSKGCLEVSGVASRLTKRVHFLRFLKIFKNKTGKREQFPNLSYGDAKRLAKEYQIAKNEFIGLMRDSGFGSWISKPIEQDSFSMDYD